MRALPKFGLLLLLLLAITCTTAEPPAPEVLVGEGEHVYAWIDDWAQLPEGDALGSMHGQVAVDSSGRVYVQTEGELAVRVFASDGAYLRGFGSEWAGGLHGLAIAREGEREVLWMTHIVQGVLLKTTLEGEELLRVGCPMESGLYERAEQYHPTSVAVSSDGTVYVGDGYGLSYIHRYTSAGEYLGSFAGRGRARGQLRNPHGLWVAPSRTGEVLLCADRENNRLVSFALDGTPLRSWTEGVMRPTFVQPREDLLAMADIEGKLTLYTRAGELLTHLGANPHAELRDRKDVPPEELLPGRFASPHGLAWAPDGSLYVVEWLEQGRITKLEPRP